MPSAVCRYPAVHLEDTGGTLEVPATGLKTRKAGVTLCLPEIPSRDQPCSKISKY